MFSNNLAPRISNTCRPEPALERPYAYARDLRDRIDGQRSAAEMAGDQGIQITNALPLLTAALLAGAGAVLTGTLDPGTACAGFANSSVLLVVVAFLVAAAVVKCGLGRRISLHVVRIFGTSTLGLGYNIFITDAIITPGFPSNTSRCFLRAATSPA